jgi:uncharacterized protein
MNDHALPVDLREVAGPGGTSKTYSGDTSVAPIRLGPHEYRFSQPVSYEVLAVQAGTGIVLTGSVQAEATVDCSRCLEPFTLPLEGGIEGFLVEADTVDSLPDDVDHQVLHEDEIDLMPYLRAALAAEAPFAPVHDEACEGICPTCGVDLNEGTCECPPPTSRSPFAVLEGMFGDREDEAGDP